VAFIGGFDERSSFGGNGGMTSLSDHQIFIGGFDERSSFEGNGGMTSSSDHQILIGGRRLGPIYNPPTTKICEYWFKHFIQFKY